MKKKHGSTHNHSSLSMQSDTQQLTFLTYQDEIQRLREKRRQLQEASLKIAHQEG